MGLALQGTGDTLKIGERVFSDLTNLVVLYGYSSTTANGSTLRKPGATAGYQVPVGKKFLIKAVRVFGQSAASTSGSAMIRALYSDNDIGIDAAKAGLTNPKYPGNDAKLGGIGNQGQIASPGLSRWEQDFDFEVPAQKYPGFGNENNTACVETVMIYGYEVSV